MDLETLAQGIARFRRIEDLLFETLGSWAAAPGDPAVAEHLAVQGQRHAWHAELWEQRMPTAGTVASGTVASGTAPSGAAPSGTAPSGAAPSTTTGSAPSADPALDAVAHALASADDPLTRLVAVYRVLLPRLIGAYRSMLAALEPRVDAPTVRILTLVLRDEVDAWQEGEALVQALVTTADDARRAADHQAHLESLLVAAGGA